MKRALVIPFPQAQRRRFVLRMAVRVTGASAKTGEKLLVAMLRRQAAVMSRKGIPLDVVQRECRKLESAIRAEMWRRLLLPDDVA
jgi:hypothetical protein